MADAVHNADQLGAALIQLAGIMAALRHPETGCPWDVEQNFATIAPYTIEEAYEVADAIERKDMLDLRDELGDLLFQVVFHSQMAAETGAFELVDVINAINGKMIRRHPHVFGDDEQRTSQEQTLAWETMKAAEREQKSGTTSAASALDGVALALPALMRAEKLQKRAARTGFDWQQPEQIIDKLEEETREVMDAVATGISTEIEEEVGDLLFVVANLARRLDVDPEIALRKANAKFEKRFRAMEIQSSENDQVFSDLSLDEQETLWQSVKRREKQASGDVG